MGGGFDGTGMEPVIIFILPYQSATAAQVLLLRLHRFGNVPEYSQRQLRRMV